MNRRSEVLLWGAQRISAMVLGVCVVVHLITMIYAVRSGLSGAEILGRTQGNVGWFMFYAVFVAAVSVHAPIGLRTIMAEMFNWRGQGANVFAAVVGLSLAMWGLRAVMAVFGGASA